MSVSLSDIEQLDRTATPGTWEVTDGGPDSSTFIDADAGDVLNHDERGHGHLRENYTWVSEPDAQLIVAYRTAAPALAGAVQAVLSRHRPRPAPFAVARCAHCQTPWPCTTVRDIAPFIDPATRTINPTHNTEGQSL